MKIDVVILKVKREDEIKIISILHSNDNTFIWDSAGNQIIIPAYDGDDIDDIYDYVYSLTEEKKITVKDLYTMKQVEHILYIQ